MKVDGLNLCEESGQIVRSLVKEIRSVVTKIKCPHFKLG
jgi:hypothetical protein